MMNLSMGENVFQAEKILKKRIRKGRDEFFVKWKGWAVRHCTWEPRENILDSSLIQLFELQEREFLTNGHKRRGRRPKRLSAPENSQLLHSQLSQPKLLISDDVHGASFVKTEPIDCMVPLQALRDRSVSRTPEVKDSDQTASHVAGEELASRSDVLEQITRDRVAADQSSIREQEDRGAKPSPWDKIKMPRKTKSPSTSRGPLHGRRQIGRPRKVVLNSNDAHRADALVGVEKVSDDAELDSNWAEKEIVVTDVCLNSDIVTFVECGTKEGFFSTLA